MSKPSVASGPSIGFKIESGNLYGYATSDGLTFYTVLLQSSFPSSSTAKDFEAVLDPGVNVKYYVDGVLKGTLTTGVPSTGGSTLLYEAYAENNGSSAYLWLYECKKMQSS